MIIPKHKVFISYHHANDQVYKDQISKQAYLYDIFEDKSVDTGDISDDLSDQQIRAKIRDEYLRDSTVTIVLVGRETKLRKHVDWEIYSSMINGTVNKKSGILIVNLPSISGSQISISDEDKDVLGRHINWSPISSYDRYDYLPDRLLDNIKSTDVRICVVDYDNISNNPQGFKLLINQAYSNKSSSNYDLSRNMRRRNG